MFERFTDRARRVVVLAQEEARLLNHNYIGTEHILLGLIHEGEGVAAKALESLGISLEAVRAQVEEIIGHGGTAPSGHIPFTPRAKKVLELSLREALQLGHNYIGTEHILLGLVREGEGVAAQVLVKLGADLSRVRQQVIQLLSGYAGAQGGRAPGRRRRPPETAQSRLARARPVRPQPHPARPRQEARPGHRAREGDRAGHAGAVPPHQEQPGAHRRARRRQDRHRRGPGHRHRRQRRARDAPGQAALHARPRRAGRRLPLPRRLRGAPQEGAEGDPHPRRHHPVHRRAAHARRCGRRRGRDRRRHHPQADARPRRAADHRRHHARRVPQAPREGRRARAPLPADQGRGADRRAHHRDPEGSARPLRGAPPGHHHRPGARRRGQPRRPLHLRPPPPRQGDRPHRRGRLPPAHPPHAGTARLPRARGRDRDRVRKEKEAAIEAQQFEQAAKLRDQEKALLEQREAKESRVARRGRRPVRRGRRGVIAEVLALWTGIPVYKLTEEETAKLLRMEDELHKRVIGQERRDQGGVPGDPPHPRRPQGPEAPARLVHLPRPVRRREDRARQDARRVPLRRRDRADPARHVRVHGEAHGVPARRLASRLRRLRRRRPAHRGRAAQAVLRRALRRDREGPPRRVQHAPADPGGRSPDRRPGPHGRLQEHRDHHDVQPRHRRPAQGRRSASPRPTRPSPTRG